jgi:3'(2'), 5'-bisphosphate nucleotidase
MDLQYELEVAIQLARAAGERVLTLRGTGLVVGHKAEEEPVTQADREADVLVTEGLRAAFPEDGILSEERVDDGSRLVKERVWMVDPVDGTQDLVRGEPGFSVMIGLIRGERPVLGVVYQPIGDRLYFASRGAGAYLACGTETSRRLRVSDVTEPSAIRMVASKSHRDESIDRVRAALAIRDELNVGSVGLKVGLIARADRDLYVSTTSRSKRWDVCAPEAILVEAGGVLSDMSGALIDYRSQELANRCGIVASNGLVHGVVIERLRELFPR